MFAIVIERKINASYSSWRILYSPRTKYSASLSQVLALHALHVFHIRPAARISVDHDGSSVCFDACYLCFPAPAGSSTTNVLYRVYTMHCIQPAGSSTTNVLYRVYTMHSIQPAEHLHSLVKTKNRCLLRHPGLKTQALTFTTWCRKTNVTNGRQRWLAEITWFITQAYTFDMKYCMWSPDGSTGNIEPTVDRKVGCEPSS